MTWTYTNAPASVAVDAVRLAIGDINTAAQLISDEGINWALSLNANNTLRAGAFCCRLIAAQFARQVNTMFDGVSISASQKSTQYLTMAGMLEAQAKKQGANAYGMPYVGGVDIDDINANRADTNRVPSVFYMGQFSNPGSNTDEQFLDSGYF